VEGSVISVIVAAQPNEGKADGLKAVEEQGFGGRPSISTLFSNPYSQGETKIVRRKEERNAIYAKG